jgi:hypothetical protein
MTLMLPGPIGRTWISLGLLALLAHAPLSSAQPTPAVNLAVAAEQGPAWPSLTPAQRGALAPLQAEWSSIDGARKQKWLELASRFQSMSADERTRVQVRMTEWVRMSPAERGRARLQFQETRQLSPQDRQSRWEAYQALPPAERNALAAKSTPDRAARRLGPDPKAAGDSPKRNLVTTAPSAAMNKAVAPTVVQATPGATTTLMSKAAAPPPHHQPGLPKIAATKGFVDPATLLPTRGPQGAAIAAAPAASGANPPRP